MTSSPFLLSNYKQQEILKETVLLGTSEYFFNSRIRRRMAISQSPKQQSTKNTSSPRNCKMEVSEQSITTAAHKT